MLGLGLGLQYARSRGGGGGDANFSKTILLLGFNGADGATTTLDESFKMRGAPTFHGDAQIDTSIAAFGAGSLQLSGAGKVTYPDHADFYMAGNDFTIELWTRFNATAGFQNLIGQADISANGAFNLDAVNGTILRARFQLVSDGMVNMQNTWNYAINTQYHVVLERSGSTFRTYAGGVMIAKLTALTNQMVDDTQDITIGSLTTAGAGITNGANARIDEVRITKGAALYNNDAGFTPPITAFPRS